MLRSVPLSNKLCGGSGLKFIIGDHYEQGEAMYVMANVIMIKLPVFGWIGVGQLQFLSMLKNSEIMLRYE